VVWLGLVLLILFADRSFAHGLAAAILYLAFSYALFLTNRLAMTPLRGLPEWGDGAVRFLPA